jgi:hypothetical protein
VLYEATKREPNARKYNWVKLFLEENKFRNLAFQFGEVSKLRVKCGQKPDRLGPDKTAVAMLSSICNLQIGPVVREGAP